ncbi:jg16594 [Pararge aegeria aegeria]|uniref:Jg16594 protein n=1 Tax=Pararge aegeria aegeria TaxID=348720 RepID=A0A8S4R7F0_9NEOP|nr:jg16594 [Pararge aegeria aegeria]
MCRPLEQKLLNNNPTVLALVQALCRTNDKVMTRYAHFTGECRTSENTKTIEITHIADKLTICGRYLEFGEDNCARHHGFVCGYELVINGGGGGDAAVEMSKATSNLLNGTD